MSNPFSDSEQIYKWVITIWLGCIVCGVAGEASCQPTSKPNLPVKVIGARTDSGLGLGIRADVSNPEPRDRTVLIHIQVPANLEFSTSYLRKGQNGKMVDRTFYSLQDEQSKNYMSKMPQGFGISPPNERNIQSISWIAPDTAVATKSRNSLVFKAKLYFFKRSPSGRSDFVGSRWVTIPVKYYS